MLQQSLSYMNEHDAWRQRVNKELGNTRKFYQAAAKNYQGEMVDPNRTPSDTNLRPYLKINGDNNTGKA